MCAVFIPYLWCSFSPIYDKRCLYECTRKALPVLLFAGIGARLTSAITLFSVGDFRFIYNLIYGGSVFVNAANVCDAAMGSDDIAKKHIARLYEALEELEKTSQIAADVADALLEDKKRAIDVYED